MKKRDDILTKTYFDERLEEKLNEKLNEKLDKKTFEDKWNKLLEKIDWLIGAYKKFEEEHTLLSHQTSNHEERLEVIESKLHIATET